MAMLFWNSATSGRRLPHQRLLSGFQRLVRELVPTFYVAMDAGWFAALSYAEKRLPVRGWAKVGINSVQIDGIFDSPSDPGLGAGRFDSCERQARARLIPPGSVRRAASRLEK